MRCLRPNRETVAAREPLNEALMPGAIVIDEESTAAQWVASEHEIILIYG
jgi:hypothetical protein